MSDYTSIETAILERLADRHDAKLGPVDIATLAKELDQPVAHVSAACVCLDSDGLVSWGMDGQFVHITSHGYTRFRYAERQLKEAAEEENALLILWCIAMHEAQVEQLAKELVVDWTAANP